MELIAELVDIIERHTRVDGVHESAIKSVGLIRSSAPTMSMPVVYQPTLCLVAQGRKQAVLGNKAYVYDASRYLVASVDLPVMGAVLEATREKPYLCLVLQLDAVELSDIAIRHPMLDVEADLAPSGLALNETTPELLDAALRLARLLDRPRDVAELSPLLVREILYRLLTGPGSQLIRQMSRANSRLNQIARSIIWIREHYTEAWSVDQLADVAGMSRSNFHAHFKSVTSMSPLAFRTQLRIQEARRIMVAEATDAASAGFRVGYESPSQFTRDYGRAFGVTPAKDAQRLRQ